MKKTKIIIPKTNKPTGIAKLIYFHGLISKFAACIAKKGKTWQKFVLPELIDAVKPNRILKLYPSFK